MKTLFCIVLLSLSVTSFAEDRWEKEVSYYNGFGGTGDRMRTEVIYHIPSDGEKKKIAQRILVDSTNEVRELWTPDQGSSDENNIVNQTVWRNLTGFVEASSNKRPDKKNSLEDCSMSEDEKTISCPQGTYVKSDAVDDSFRGPKKEIDAPKQTPGSDIIGASKQ